MLDSDPLQQLGLHVSWLYVNSNKFPSPASDIFSSGPEALLIVLGFVLQAWGTLNICEIATWIPCQATPHMYRWNWQTVWRGELLICGWSKLGVKHSSPIWTGKLIHLAPDSSNLYLRIVYLQKRNVRWIIENPSSSLLWRYKCIRVTCQQTCFCKSQPINVLQQGVFSWLVYTCGINQEPDIKVWRYQSERSFGGIWSLYCKASPLPALSSGCEIEWRGAIHAPKVTLVGTVPWLSRLRRTLTREMRADLDRIKRFLKLETTKTYKCKRTGKTKCVHILDSPFSMSY